MARSPKRDELIFLAISGINYPTKHRKYLLDLVRDVAVKHEAAFILLAGNAIDGKALEDEYKHYIKYEVEEQRENSSALVREAKELVRLSKDLKKKLKEAEKAKDKSKARKLRVEIKQLQKNSEYFAKKAKSFNEESFRDQSYKDFVARHTSELNSLLPKIPDTNYHIAIAQTIYDHQIGVDILECLRTLRDDVRLIGAEQDGTYDPEPKVPSQLKGFEDIRVILPRRTPWFYRIISSFMQRLINAFIPRTQSPQPDLILVGCTGTAAYLPYYDGVPSISIPTLHRLNEQLSTENMVGCSVVRIVVGKDRKRIIWGTYDFRPAIFNERRFSIPKNATSTEQSVLRALIPSPASLKTLVFRIMNQDEQTTDITMTSESVQTLKALIQKKLVVYNRNSNQYAISEKHIQETAMSLEQLFKNSKQLTQTIASCFHCGCPKTLYHTCFRYLPENAIDSDVLVENGDGIQGIAHAYEYNTELLPTMMGYDKQERTLAAIRRRNIMDIFKLRFDKFKDKFAKQKVPAETILDHCFIEYIFQKGNHPSWKYYQKSGLILGEFEELLKQGLIESILTFCSKHALPVSYGTVKNLVNRKIRRVGEHYMIQIKGFTMGIKHPFKARTNSKSHRIQDVIDFVWRQFYGFINNTLKDKKTAGFVIADIANFHEAAAVHVAKFGRTALGVMTGAQVKDTRFESDIDKIVDHGTANVTVVKNEDDRLLYSEVEFDNRIHPDDEKICFADRLMTSDILNLCQMLDREVKLPWRL